MHVYEKGRRIRQAEAAAAIDVARTTIVVMEQGQRRPRTSELLKLAKLYKTTVNALLRQEAIHIDLTPRFRKLASCKDGGLQSALGANARGFRVEEAFFFFSTAQGN